MIRLVAPVDIASAKYPFERIVGAVRRVVTFEQIVIAAHVDSIGSQTREKEAVSSQSGIISSENVVTGLEDDQKPRRIRSQVRTSITQIISAAIVSIVVCEGTVRSVIEMKTKSAAIICDVVR